MRVAENLIPSWDFAPTVNVRSVGAFGSGSVRLKSLNLRGRRTENPPSVDAAVTQPDASGSPACTRCIVIPWGRVWQRAGKIDITETAKARNIARRDVRHVCMSDDSGMAAAHARKRDYKLTEGSQIALISSELTASERPW